MTTITQLVTEICHQQAIPLRIIDDAGVVLELQLPQRSHLIVNNHLGLISEADAVLCTDKAYQAQLLADIDLMPLTHSYLDPSSKYASTETPNLAQITADIQDRFSLPVMVKKNSGREGVHVFKAQSAEEMTAALNQIFNPHHSEYDHVAVVQPYLEATHEYRVLMWHGQAEVAYTKVAPTQSASFVSAERWAAGRAELVTDSHMLRRLQTVVTTLYQRWPLAYAGLDIIEDPQGRLWLIEVNSAPAITHVVRDNGPEIVRPLFQKMISWLAAH